MLFVRSKLWLVLKIISERERKGFDRVRFGPGSDLLELLVCEEL